VGTITRTRDCGILKISASCDRTTYGVWVDDQTATCPSRTSATQTCVSSGTVLHGRTGKDVLEDVISIRQASVHIALAQLEMVADVRAGLRVEDHVGERMAREGRLLMH